MRVHLRPATSSDAPFLARVHRSTRDDLTAAGLPEDALAVVLAQQHDSQERAYEARFADISRFLVVVDDVAVGRVYLDRDSDGVRVLDIAVLPAHRRQGVATAVLRRVIELAGERPVHLTVRRGSRAIDLYRRVGFVEVGRTATDVAMTADSGRTGHGRSLPGRAGTWSSRQPNDTT